MYKAGACIRYSRLDLFIIKQWPSPPLVPKPTVQGRKWPGRAFTGIRHTRNYTCWLPESYPFTVACWTRTPVLHFPLIEHTDALLAVTKKGFIRSWIKGDLQEQIVSAVFFFSGNQWHFVLRKMHSHWTAENSIIYDRSRNVLSSHICTSTGKWNLSYIWPERRGEICQVPAGSTSFWHFDTGEIYKVLGCC